MNRLIDVTDQHVLNSQDVNFYYLRDGEFLTSKNYAEIIADAKKLAAYLSQRFEHQSRILLIYPTCLDFISSFLGCLYAGMIAVPVYPLQNPKHADRVHCIIDSCEPKLILGNKNAIEDLSQIESLDVIEKIATESVFVSKEFMDFKINPSVNESTIALLQYTSGATGKPKGVMVTHGNLMSNLASLKTGLGLGENKTSVIWLPFQHDLGLISGVLASLYNKNNLVLLPPEAVLKQPFLWLKALTDFKAYFTVGPNFAYQLCADKITDEELSALDLSSVGYALTAAEPNRYETMEQFCSKFAVCGFKKEAYCVGYGLAENTLHVTTNTPGVVSTWMSISKAKLAKRQIQLAADEHDRYLILSAGKLHPAHEVVIVNPETNLRCDVNEVGEIWIHSQSVAMGYWGNPEASEATFNAHIEGEKKSYLRTGDLGFIHDDQLYITGRQEDLILIDGSHIYPQAFEAEIDIKQPTSLLVEPGLRTDPEQLVALQKQIKEQVSAVTKLPIEDISDDIPLFDLGMDSLMAVDLKERLQTMIGDTVPLNAALIFDYPDILSLSEYLADKLLDTESEKLRQTTKEHELSAKNYIAELGVNGYFIKQGLVGVLIINGLGGTPGAMKEFATALTKHNVTVAIPQLAGHCSSLDDFKNSTWRDWYQSVEKALGILEKQCDTIFVAGLSAGALLAINLAVNYRAKIAGTILLSPALFFDGWNIPKYKRILLPAVVNTPLKYLYSLKQGTPFGIKNESRRAAVESLLNTSKNEYSVYIGHTVIPGTVLSEMVQLAKQTKQILPQFSTPTIIIQSQVDDMTSTKNAEYIKDYMGSNQVEIKYLDDSYHLITIDNQKELVSSYAVEFIETCLSKLEKKSNKG